MKRKKNACPCLNPARSLAQRRLFGLALSIKRKRGKARRRALRTTGKTVRRLVRLSTRTLRAYARGGKVTARNPTLQVIGLPARYMNPLSLSALLSSAAGGVGAALGMSTVAALTSRQRNGPRRKRRRRA